jgi:hypothetical protein
MRQLVLDGLAACAVLIALGVFCVIEAVAK